MSPFGKLIQKRNPLIIVVSREGHATIIDEIASKLDGRPDVVVASVGGGGLMNGLVIGMERNNWKDVPLVAMETEGANCFNEALKAGKVVTLPAITR